MSKDLVGRRAPGEIKFLRVAVVINHRLLVVQGWDTSVRDASSKGGKNTRDALYKNVSVFVICGHANVHQIREKGLEGNYQCTAKSYIRLAKDNTYLWKHT